MSTTSGDTRRSSTTGLARFALAMAGVALQLPAISSCANAAAPAGVARTDSAGVEIVDNTGPDHPLGWSLDSVLSLRSPTGQGGDTIGFFGVTDVAVTGGRIVVLDRSVPALFVYDSLGHVQGRYGRKGKGPGEFESPVSVAAAPGGGVAVFDMGNQRIERFDTSFAPSGSLPLLSVLARQGAMRFAGDAAVLTTERISADTAIYGLAAIGPTDTTVIATLRQQRNRKAITLKGCGFWIRPGFISPVFAPELHWTVDRNADVLVNNSDRYDIAVYTGSRFTLTGRIRRDKPPIRATKEMAVETLGEDPNGCDAEDRVEKAGLAPTVPPLGEMKVAPGGDIWVHRWVPEADSVIDMFDSTGVYMGTLKGAPMPIAFLGDDRVIVQGTDSLDVPFLTIYRVVR